MEKGKGCVSDEVERPSSGKLCLAQGRPGIYLVFILDWMRLSHTKEMLPELFKVYRFKGKPFRKYSHRNIQYHS